MNATEFEAEVLNILTDCFIPRGTGDWNDYEQAKRQIRTRSSWTSQEWEQACRIASKYVGV
jgi:hypothetical protein